MTPKYGNCKDCAAWKWFTGMGGAALCVRHPPTINNAYTPTYFEQPYTYHSDGCFDHIPKEEGNG